MEHGTDGIGLAEKLGDVEVGDRIRQFQWTLSPLIPVISVSSSFEQEGD